MALAGEGARSDAIDDRRRCGSVTTLSLVFAILLAILMAAAKYTPYEDGALWPMCWVWDPAFVYRPISRPITFYRI
jgi:hypothetical protein